MSEKVNIPCVTMEWIEKMNTVSSSLIERAFENDIDNWLELTPIVAGDFVHYNGDYVEVLECYDSKFVLKCSGEDSIYLNDSIDLIEAIYVNNERLEFSDYIEEKGIFLLEDGKEVSIEGVDKILYNDYEATILNTSKVNEIDIDYIVELELTKTVDDDEVELECKSWLPMWGYLWSFNNKWNTDWTRDNADIVASCGFRIFEDQREGEIYIGIDGAGYDFLSAHWIPLYKAMHNIDETVALA